MKPVALALVLLLGVTLAPAQSLKEYLRLRQRNGVDHAVEIDALRDLTVTKVLELHGVVKGSFRQGNRLTLLVSRPDGGTTEVDSDFVCDWLIAGDEVPARFLVRAIHSDETGLNHIVLLGAARESEIAPIDAALAAKRKRAADAAAAALAARETKAKTPAPERNRRSGLFGPIGGGHASRGGVRRDWVLPSSSVTPIYASYIKGMNRKLADSEALRIAQGIIGFCLHYGVDPRLVMAVVSVESEFDPSSVSRSGAMGLGQLMPSTARWMGVSDPFDVVDNIYGMVKLLHTHLNQYNAQTGDPGRALELALAAYNAGEGAVRRHGGIPPYRETRAYIRHVLTLYDRLSR